jgi:hypothetical protein
MSKHIFDGEKRQEAARIEELRGLLDQVEKPGFWDRLSKAQSSLTEEPDSFHQAIERRAEALGVHPQSLLSDYIRQLRESTYPTPECLEAEEVQRIVALHSLTPEQATHVRDCAACQQLLTACQQSAAETEKLIAVVRKAAAEADQQQIGEPPTVAKAFTASASASTPVDKWTIASFMDRLFR